MSTGTVEWHQAQRTISDPKLGDITLIVGQTRDGDLWIAPLGTPPATSYPPSNGWIYLADDNAWRDAILGG